MVRRIMQQGGRTSILLEEAQGVIQAAMQKAEDIGQPMNVAVVDNGRDLKAFARMEDAWLGSIDIAINKAFTSASFLMPTEDLTEMTQPGQPLYGLEATNNGRVVIDDKNRRIGVVHVPNDILFS